MLNRSTWPAKANSSISSDVLNKFFQNVAVSPSHQPANSFSLLTADNNESSFSFSEVSVDTVLRLLSSLNVQKSTGPDGLSARYLKEIAVEIVTPLIHLYNMSLKGGIIPQDWKQSHISPVHKGGNFDDPSIYRPISVVSVVAKVLEKIVSDQLSLYLENHKLLHPHQGAYWHGKSTEDILLVVVDSIVHHLDNGKYVCVAFLDLKKAFDSLDHCILLTQLSS